LHIYNSSNPPSASPHEDTTIAVVMPITAVYNNLVRFDLAKSRNSYETIIPELATAWEWNAVKTKLTFRLRDDVKWHDGTNLDAIEWRIVPDRSTRILAFAAAEFDLTKVADITPPLFKDLQKNAPNAVCSMPPANVTTHLLINRERPRFDNPALRRAMLLSLDRQAATALQGPCPARELHLQQLALRQRLARPIGEAP
jgi:ABC-type transport system substrate-binding protein